MFDSPAENVQYVRKALAAHAMVIRRRDGEYRVNFKGGPESTAYYTDDLADAFRTGLHMATEPRPATRAQARAKYKRAKLSYGRR